VETGKASRVKIKGVDEVDTDRERVIRVRGKHGPGGAYT
jgi:hypothetical protein